MVKMLSNILLGSSLALKWWTLNVQAQAIMTVVDDVDSSLKYSNSGPAWIAGTYNNGGTPHDPYPSGPNNTYMAYEVTYHEAYGDGASVQMVFTGTRIRVNATVPKIGYSTRVGFYIDGNLISTYDNELPATPTPTSNLDYNCHVVLFDQDGLAPAQHTMKAVTVGSDSLFLFDVLEFEASAAVATSAAGAGAATSGATGSNTASATGNSTATGATTGLSSTLSSTSSATTKSSLTSNDGANLPANPATSTVIATANANSGGNSNSAIATSTTKKTTTAVAAVIGGLAGIALFILVGFFVLKRWRQKKADMMYDDAAKALPWNENGTENGHTGSGSGTGGLSGTGSRDGEGYGSYTAEDSEMGQRSWQVPLAQNNGIYQVNQDLSTHPYAGGPYPTQAQAANAGPILAHLQRSNATTTDSATDMETDIDSRTYQTLPSYHERVLESASEAGRNLSQADINAISQRLTEMMRSHIQQQSASGNGNGSGGNPQAPLALNALDGRVIVPPRELITHLVEERLNEREAAEQ